VLINLFLSERLPTEGHVPHRMEDPTTSSPS